MTQKNALAFHSVTIKSGDNYNPPKAIHHAGFTAIEYAAIHTGQPRSGTPWLDEMIRAQRLERLAGLALVGLLRNHKPEISNIGYVYPSDKEPYCRASVSFADALIAALEGGAK